jgi:hypothetical protein
MRRGSVVTLGGQVSKTNYVTTDAISNRFGASGRLVRSSLAWAITAVAVATLVCFLAFYFYALFFIRFMIVPALALGLFHSVWVYLERKHFADASDASFFGTVSGGFAGLLGFPPAFANVTDVIFGWSGIAVLIAASVIGGAIAGRTWVGFVHNPTAAARRPQKRFARGALLLVTMFVLEIAVYGPVLRLKLPVWIVLKRDVIGLRAGNARGSSWSGEFQYSSTSSHGSGIQGTSGGIMTIVHDNGHIAIANVASKDLEGGIDSNGRFWAGSETGRLRTRLDGKFSDADHFSFTVRRSVFEDGVFPKNSTLEDGSGNRWMGWK